MMKQKSIISFKLEPLVIIDALKFNFTLLILDPININLEHSYNLNAIKVVEVTDDFISLDENIIKCQNDETKDDCITRKYIEEIQRQCECLPLQLRQTNKVKSSL